MRLILGFSRERLRTYVRVSQRLTPEMHIEQDIFENTFLYTTSDWGLIVVSMKWYTPGRSTSQ